MKHAVEKNVSQSEGKKKNGCLACGTTENIGRRKYCSVECRHRLRNKLNVRTGLLKALNIRNATFYFTESIIIMDVLPYDSKEIFSFICPRLAGAKPGDDFSRMADMLGNAWWAEKKRTNKKYLASRYVFKFAKQNTTLSDSAKPLEIKIPSIKATSLIHLKLGKSDLNSPELKRIIKSAYRHQAKNHHPDLGGDTDTFRKIHQAYEELINWAASPTFVRRRGFPDKWSYNANTNRWVQPLPKHKK